MMTCPSTASSGSKSLADLLPAPEGQAVNARGINCDRVLGPGAHGLGPARPDPEEVRCRGRADRHAVQSLPRTDRGVRPVPRPQVRPDPHLRLLRAGGHLRQHANFRGLAEERFPLLQAPPSWSALSTRTTARRLQRSRGWSSSGGWRARSRCPAMSWPVGFRSCRITCWPPPMQPNPMASTVPPSAGSASTSGRGRAADRTWPSGTQRRLRIAPLSRRPTATNSSRLSRHGLRPPRLGSRRLWGLRRAQANGNSRNSCGTCRPPPV